MVPLLVWTFQVVATSNRRTLERFETLKDPLQVDSLRERLDLLWPAAWADFRRSPLVGHGPGKSFLQYYVGARLEGYVDSEYLGALRTGGIIGFSVFLSYYCFPLYLIWKGQRATRFIGNLLVERTPAILMTMQAALIMGALALVMNIGMATFSTPFLQGFLWLWLGLGARSAATIRGLLQAQPSTAGFTPGYADFSRF
jgi:O-antigen ligase